MELASVRQWYQELRWFVEPECMSVLQSKSLIPSMKSGRAPTISFQGSSSPQIHSVNCQESESPRSGSGPSPASSNSSASLPRIKPDIPATFTPKEHIDMIVDRAQTVSAEFGKLFRRIEKSRYKQVQASTLRIIQYLRSLIDDCDNAVHDPGPNIWEHEEAIIECCATLEDDLERLAHSTGPHTDVLIARVTSLGHSFGRLVDAVVSQLILMILSDIDETKRRRIVQEALDQLIKLSLDGEHMCYLIARESGVAKLFEVCQNEKMMSCWAFALRTLAAVCCVRESVQELERVNGVDTLSIILDQTSLGEDIRAEAAGLLAHVGRSVIAQVTSSSLDHARYLHGFIENIDNLTRSLTGLCDDASNPEVFLLGAAALANITFMDSLACDYLHHYHAARVLIDACQLHKADSLFAKDQVVTVIANMVTLDQCCVEVTSYNGIELLIQFLDSTPSRTKMELAAIERVQQKTAVALTRLARNPDIAQIIVECGGVEKLVSLCRNPADRNKSDSVLMACVAALKRISRACPDQHFTAEDVDNLLQSSLIDSFLSSNMEETFV